VVIPVTTSAWTMLQRNMLYSADTGPRSSCSSAPARPRTGRAHGQRRPAPHRTRPLPDHWLTSSPS
jgi:hypothetical protein